MELQDWLDTVLAYLKVIVWPAVVVWGLWMFRTQLRDFVGRVRRAKAPGFEFEVAEQVRHLSEASERLPELAAAQQVRDAQPPEEGLDADGPEPATLLGRMLLAWSALEEAAAGVAARRGMGHSGRNLGVLVEHLNRDGIVSEQTKHVARTLQAMRNEIVHRAPSTILNPWFVDDFTEATTNLATVLRAVPGLDRGKTVNTGPEKPPHE